MADVKISALPAASALTGTELVPIVQGGVTVQSTPAAFVSNGTLAGSFTQVGIGTSTPGSFGKLAVLSSGAPTTAYAAIMSSVAGYNSSWESTLYLGSARTDTVNNNAIAGYRIKNYGADANGSYLAIEAGSSPSTSAAPPTTYTERLRLDASGNLGLGVTPSAWGSNYKAIQNPAGGIGAYSTASVAYAQNAYDSGVGAWKYLTTGIGAGFYNQSLGTHTWYNAPSGTAGNAITFTQAMTLDASGQLQIGTTLANGQLTVQKSTASTNGNAIVASLLRATSGTAAAGLAGALQYTMQDAGGNLINTNSIRSEWVDPAIGTRTAKLVFTSASGNFQTDAMTLDASGNLGIGTASPSSYGKLVVWGGNAFLQSTTAGVGSKITLSDPNNAVSVESSPVGVASNMVFKTSTLTQMTLDASGNLGLGVTPSAWAAGWKVFQAAGNTVVAGPTIAVVSNAYNDGAWKYTSTAAASQYAQGSGAHYWYTAPSGTADTAISFTQAMTLDANGSLVIGGTNALNSLTKVTLTDGTITSVYGYLTGGVAYEGTTSNHPLAFLTNNTERMRLDTSGNLITTVNAAAPSLSTNSTMSFELTSNTSLKVVVRGTDGVTRSVSLTLS